MQIKLLPLIANLSQIRTEYIVRPSLEQEKPRLKSIDFSFKTGWKINISSKCRVSVCTTVEL